jgi:Protein of unknown function (DUF1552)
MRVLRPPMDRRTVLRGAGVTLALPLLEAMIPKGAAAAAALRPKRFSLFYMSNGMIMEKFTPTNTGAGYEISQTLKSLEPHRKGFTVITGLAADQAEALGDGGGDHARACGGYLSGVHVKKTEGFDLRASLTMDQIFAKKFSEQTQLASLEMGIEPPSFVGSCDTGYSCAYTNTLSWTGPAAPLPITVSPREVFERLFGDQDKVDPATRTLQLRRQASILDFVSASADLYPSSLGAEDRHKLDEYTSSVRDLERRIQMAESQSSQNADLGAVIRPTSGIPENFIEHVRLMIDLQVLAMQADLTRVSTLMTSRELSNRSYTEIGISDSHHSISHHGGDPEKMAKLARIQAMYFEQFGYYLTRMKETKDGDGTLFDTTMAWAGSGFGDSNSHDHQNMPLVVAGGLAKGDQHIRVAKGTPFSNVLVAGMQTMGFDVDKFGDSKAAMTEAFV